MTSRSAAKESMCLSRRASEIFQGRLLQGRGALKHTSHIRGARPSEACRPDTDQRLCLITRHLSSGRVFSRTYCPATICTRSPHVMIACASQARLAFLPPQSLSRWGLSPVLASKCLLCRASAFPNSRFPECPLLCVTLGRSPEVNWQVALPSLHVRPAHWTLHAGLSRPGSSSPEPPSA